MNDERADAKRRNKEIFFHFVYVEPFWGSEEMRSVKVALRFRALIPIQIESALNLPGDITLHLY